jgi:hypothetical protein
MEISRRYRIDTEGFCRESGKCTPRGADVHLCRIKGKQPSPTADPEYRHVTLLFIGF